MLDYTEYRREHPGPLSKKSFEFWRRNGGKDLDSFAWKNKKNNKKQKKQKNNQKNKQKQKKALKIYKNEIKSMTGNVYYY